MNTSRFSDSQILSIFRQAEAGTPVPDLCREHGISSATFYIRSSNGGVRRRSSAATTVRKTSTADCARGRKSATFVWSISSPASRSRTPISSPTTKPYATTGWGNSCSIRSMKFKTSPPSGSEGTITNGRIWPWEASPQNRSWRLLPSLYFWRL